MKDWRSRPGALNYNWKGGNASLTCQQCAKTFDVKPCRATKARFCSMKCANDWQSLHPYTGQKRAPRSRRCTATERFWSRTNKSDGCWLWIGRLNSHGYGTISASGKHMLAHRYSYQINVGPIPDGLLVCHSCDNPRCVNPAHLFVGTQLQNMRDAKAKGRMVLPPRLSGDSNPITKLHHHDIQAIRLRWASGESQCSIARDYQVSDALISNLIRGKYRFGLGQRPVGI